MISWAIIKIAKHAWFIHVKNAYDKWPDNDVHFLVVSNCCEWYPFRFDSTASTVRYKLFIFRNFMNRPRTQRQQNHLYFPFYVPLFDRIIIIKFTRCVLFNGIVFKGIKLKIIWDCKSIFNYRVRFLSLSFNIKNKSFIENNVSKRNRSVNYAFRIKFCYRRDDPTKYTI